MKTWLLFLLCGGTVAGSVYAQSAANLPSPGSVGSAGAATAASPGPVVISRGSDSRVWANEVTQTNQLGTVVTVTNQAYTELASGLCYLENGVWMDSVEQIDIVADGAGASHAQFKVHWMGNVNTAAGAVSLTTPEGQSLVSRVYGLSYLDTATGTSVLFASLQDSQGQLAGNNQIVYPDAFNGCKADIEYVYSVAGLEQNIILREQPPLPAVYGLNPQTTVIQVLTEFFNPPAPRIITGEENGVAHDAYLDFGKMGIGVGGAFFLPGQGGALGAGNVFKHWTQLSGRDFLVEEIGWPAIANFAQALPLHASAAKPGKNVIDDIASRKSSPSKRGIVAAATPVKVAKSSSPRPGLVIDYSILSSASNLTLQSDTTYYVSGNVLLGGTNTTFEGGTVLKYASGVTLTVQSPVTWLASAYMPVVMTAKDDNTVGGTISGSTGNPGTAYYAGAALYFNGSTAGTNLSLQFLHVLNAQTAVALNGQSNHIVGNVQMVNCGNGVAATNATFSLWNGLMYNVMTNFTGSTSTGDVEHLTVDTANWLNNGQTLNLTNCLLAAVTNTGSFSSDSVYTAGSGAGVFQAVGGGSHYLAAGSPCVNAGTTNIAATLAGYLAQMTTYPPVLLTNNFSANTTLSPQAQRDTDIPDIGYHYPALDFVCSNLTINSGVTLTLTNGVALGFLASSGLTVYGSLVSQGTPLTMNRLGCGGLVQEKVVAELRTLILGNGAWQALFLRFTELPTQAQMVTYLSVLDAYSRLVQAGPLTLQDCWLRGGLLSVNLGWFNYAGTGDESSLTATLVNNLIERGYIILTRQESESSALSVNFYNNLCHDGAVALTYDIAYQDDPSGEGGPVPPSWYFYDSLFEGAAVTETGTSPLEGVLWNEYVFNGFNGYRGSNPFPYEYSDGNVTVTNFDYQKGALGNYYYPTNGGNLSTLIHVGSRLAAAAGLYHYTVTTNNAVEGTNRVSIGFHYIAVGANGLPLDSNGNGIPDYLEDANGNGVVDSGETDWQSATDLGLMVWITRPANNSTIP